MLQHCWILAFLGCDHFNLFSIRLGDRLPTCWCHLCGYLDHVYSDFNKVSQQRDEAAISIKAWPIDARWLGFSLFLYTLGQYSFALAALLCIRCP